MNGDMACAVCGTANPPDYRFCGECGVELRRSESAVAGEPADVAAAEQGSAVADVVASTQGNAGDKVGMPPMSEGARLRLTLLWSAGALALLGLLILPFGGDCVGCRAACVGGGFGCAGDRGAIGGVGRGAVGGFGGGIWRAG